MDMNPDRERLLRLAESEDGCPIGVGGMFHKQEHTMKVLFLDIDGVLNSAHVIAEQRNASAIDREMVERVNRIVDATGCKIVLSTSWRLYQKLDKLSELLYGYGLRQVIIDRTPDLDRSTCNRGDEILSWLSANPTVESIIILDDWDDMGGVSNRLVQTTYRHGLQDKHVELAIRLLNEA